MTSSFSLSEYTWKDALLWGNCWGHCKKAAQEAGFNRVIHVIIAAAEALPIIGQIISICEKLLMNREPSSSTKTLKIKDQNPPLSPLPSHLIPGSPNPTSQPLDYQQFMETRCPNQLDMCDYFPSPAQKRKETFQLEDKSTSYTQNLSVSLRKDSQPKENESIPSYLRRIYQEYHHEEGAPRGLVFAGFDFMYSVEGKHPALHFLETHIQLLKEIGIKKIYLEQLTGFNHFSKDKDNDKAYSIHEFFYSAEKPNPVRGLPGQIIDLAKSHGLEVIGAEVMGDRQQATIGFDSSSRLRNFNLHAAELIRTVNEPFVVFVGAAHGKLRRDSTPGLSEYLDCPCIGLGSTQLVSEVQTGTHRFSAGHYSVDAVFAKDEP